MSGPVQPPLTVETVDGATVGRPITKIKVSNGDLTISGNVATIDTSGGGGGGTGTVTSIALEGDTGTTTAITTAGAFKIVGAGTTGVTATGTTVTVTSNDQYVGTVTGITSFAPLAVDNTNPAIPALAMPQSNTGQDGWLSDTDWNTFNGKQDSITLTTTGTSGAATFAGGTLNIPQYSGTTGTVTGTGVANQVSYWTAASVQAGSTGLTYDPSTGNLTVGGYVETGTKVTTPSGTALTLEPGGASSGSIAIADGANGQISITPNGTGTIKLDGVNLDNSAIATGYVLKATSTTAAGWAAESGGGITFPIEADSGSSSAPSYSFSADTDTGIYLAGASNMAIAAGGQNYLFIGSLGSVQFNKKALFNAATAAAPNGFATDTNTGFFQPSADTIGFSTAGTEKIRFGSSGEILIGGTAAGAANQVLTSGGTGAAVSWTTPSGGGLTPRFSGIKANSNAYYDLSAYPTGWRTNAYTNFLESQTAPIWCPFTCGIDLTLSTLGIQVTTAGATGLKYLLGVYSTDSDGLPDALLVKSEVVADVTGTQTATVTETSAGDADLVAGVQYWYCYTRNTQTPSSYATLRSGGFEFTGNITDNSIGSQRQSIRSGSTGTLPLTYSGSGAPIGNANAIVGCTYA
tara:strand:- start:779 stop:2680 length:1902 start_codon:yes stop_codon:yes gene_type:complete